MARFLSGCCSGFKLFISSLCFSDCPSVYLCLFVCGYLYLSLCHAVYICLVSVCSSVSVCLLGPCTYCHCISISGVCVSPSHLGEVSVTRQTRAHPGRHPPPALLLEPKLGFKAAAAPRASLGSGGPLCACGVKAMNGGVAGSTLAAGAAGKPGAPEDAARVHLCPEVEGRDRGRLRRCCRGSRNGSRRTLGNTASSHLSPLLPAGCQLWRHLLASTQGLWRNLWPWGRGMSHIWLQ